MKAFKFRPDLKRIAAGFTIIAGLIIFAAFIHQKGIIRAIAIAGIFLSAFTIHFVSRGESIRVISGLNLVHKRILLYLLIGIIAGILLGLFTRYEFDLPLFPERLTISAIVAPVIGMTEEFIFRGFIQGYLRASGRIFSILFAAMGHTLYKFVVIFSLPGPLEFNFLNLIIATFVVGVLAGLLREGSKSVVPSAMGHACFDIILYGSFTALPVWVWS